jgi:hypothetical protein
MNHTIVREPLPLNQVPAEHVLKHAQVTYAKNHEVGFKLYLLFDAARHEDGLKVAQTHARNTQAALSNLLAALLEGDVPEVGFYLLAIAPDQAHELFAYWASPDRQPAAIWLWSHWDTSRLAAHLSRFVEMEWGADQRGLVRFADPLVWQALMDGVYDPIGQHLHAPVGACWQSDLDGQWYSTRLAQRPKQEMPALPLRLKPAAMTLFHAALWPAQIYYALYPNISDEPAIGARKARLLQLEDEYARAVQWGGIDAQDFVMFSSLADAFHTRFDATPEFARVLESARQGKLKLSTTLAAVAPAIWDAVERDKPRS